jgi:transposase
MDNLTAHKGERVKELIEGQGCELVYLPPYSPDLNPIEEAFSKIKGIEYAKPRPVAEKLSNRSSTRRLLTSRGSHPDSERNHCKLWASLR